ncbi:MAG: YciI family protein [Hyphomicrobium sp.]
MRFMSMVKSSEDYRLGPPPQELMEAMDKLGEEMKAAGAMIDMGGLLPSAMNGYRVRLSGGKLSVTDGPFSEAKEVIGGYAVFAVKTKEEAVEWTRRFMDLHRVHWPEWEGEAEVRQMFEGPGCPDDERSDPRSVAAEHAK